MLCFETAPLAHRLILSKICVSVVGTRCGLKHHPHSHTLNNTLASHNQHGGSNHKQCDKLSKGLFNLPRKNIYYQISASSVNPLWGESSVTSRFPHKGPAVRRFVISLVWSLNKLLSKESNYHWFKTQWRSRIVKVMYRGPWCVATNRAITSSGLSSWSIMGIDKTSGCPQYYACG